MANLSVGQCTIDSIMHDACSGQIKIPQFQREYVWSVRDCAKLLDSILKGYPVGSLIYWKTKESLRVVRNIGDFRFPAVPADDYAFYVLDGQQRITSLLACLMGQTIEGVDYSEIYIDLTATTDEQIVVQDVSGRKPDEYVSLCELYEFDLGEIMKKHSSAPGFLSIVNEYNKRLTRYQFSKTELSEASLAVATEVFTRINTSGKSLTMFEIMCAKMYSENPAFDLYEKRAAQRTDWQMAGFEGIPDTVVLQAMGACLCKSSKGADILSLDKDRFIAAWDDVEAALEMTIDYFKNTFGVPVSKLVPYDALFVVFAYYFYHAKKRPTGDAQKYLRDYFWRATFSERFSEGVVSKINQDLVNVIDVILSGGEPVYREGLVITKDSITRDGVFVISSGYVKGILCIMCSKNPVSFIDGHSVTIDNSWLSQGNSRNYHHFFPKEYMRKNQPLIPEHKVNHIVNITVVDGWLNKGKIKAKAPSVYMAEFANVNPNLPAHMRSHLIGDLSAFGIDRDDYLTFFEERIKLIHAEMVALLIEREEDNFQFV